MDTETNRIFPMPCTTPCRLQTTNDGESTPVEYVLGSGVLLNKKKWVSAMKGSVIPTGAIRAVIRVHP